MAKDLLGTALWKYVNGDYSEDIATFSSLDEEDMLPLPYLFRDYEQMPSIEKNALQHCSGTVLDIGCGAGSHSLYLQEQGFDVTALDTSEGAVRTSQKRGVQKVLHADFFTLNGQRYDTLLLLMNGIGIVGTLDRIDAFFEQVERLLRPNGQVLLDSSDIIYMFDEDDDGGYWVPDGQYYGEVIFEMQHLNEKSGPFPWLYLDFTTLERAADAHGFDCELVMEGEHYDYLARLTKKTY